MLTKVGNASTQTAPRASVVMGIYNCATTLPEAIESILQQSYDDWELLLCDDCSTDDTYNIAQEFARKDSRIKLLRNTENMGYNIVLNRCIAAARGIYIAIMDSDDVSLSHRLAREAAFLDEHPQYALVGCAASFFDEQGDFGILRKKEMPSPKDFAYSIPHLHATCMIRRDALTAIGGYGSHPRMKRVEDYYMLARLYAAGYRGYNLQEVLYRICDNAASYKRRTWQNRMNEVYTFRAAHKLLRLPFYSRIALLRPILVGIMPNFVYHLLHRKVRLRQK